MPPFPELSFDYTYDPAVEIAAFRDWRKNKPGRQIPARRSNRLLVATWNAANLGLQQRTDGDHALIAEILRWFDLVAVQDTNDNLTGCERCSRSCRGSTEPCSPTPPATTSGWRSSTTQPS